MEIFPLWYGLIVFFVIGACVGSFYNVVVYRMPRGISLVNPPSHCPLCKKRIPLYLNLPIVGWLMLRGKSACCKQPISPIYPIGEALCGLLGLHECLPHQRKLLYYHRPYHNGLPENEVW